MAYSSQGMPLLRKSVGYVKDMLAGAFSPVSLSTEERTDAARLGRLMQHCMQILHAGNGALLSADGSFAGCI